MKTIESTSPMRRGHSTIDTHADQNMARRAGRHARALRGTSQRLRASSAKHFGGSDPAADGSQKTSLANLCGLLETVDHIKLKNHLATMSYRVATAVARYGEAKPQVLEIDRIYVEFLHRLWTHMFREENLYTSICNLERDQVKPLRADSLLVGTVRLMRRDHRYFSKVLRRIAALLRNYQLPSKAGTTYRELVDGFRELEAFKLRHMENERALYSQALTLEKQLMGKYPRRQSQARWDWR